MTAAGTMAPEDYCPTAPESNAYLEPRCLLVVCTNTGVDWVHELLDTEEAVPVGGTFVSEQLIHHASSHLAEKL
jgi:hypothetical protein